MFVDFNKDFEERKIIDALVSDDIDRNKYLIKYLDNNVSNDIDGVSYLKWR